MRNFADRLSCLSDRVVTIDANGTSHLAATLPQEIPGNVPRFMTDSIAVLEDGYSEVVVNVMAPQVEVAALLADVGRPRMMTTNSTGDRLYFEHEPWHGSVIIVAKLFEGAYD